MNELEKATSEENVANLSPEVAETVKECVVKECVETESPALAVSEAAEKAETQDVCAVNDSPAMDVSDVADEQQSELSEKTDFQTIHSMSKTELRDALKEILDSENMEAHKEVAAIKQVFYMIKTRETEEQMSAFVEAGNDPTVFIAEADEVETEFKELYSDFKNKRAAFIAAEDARRAENLEKKKEILTTMEEIAGDIDNVNTRFSDFQMLQQAFKEIKDVTPSAETEIWKQFQNVVERFYDNLKINKELRDFDFKKNLEAKKALIEDARALEQVADPIAAFRTLQGLHDQWRAIGPVAKEIREEIWEQFKEASTVVNKRHQEHFEQRKAAEQVNEEAKTKLCEEIEAIKTDELNSFALWNAATEKIIELQKRWKEYGFASRKANVTLYARFRKACDDFFEQKTAFFQKAKEELNENLAKKMALCERAEALKDSDDIKKATDEIVKLQAEWKTIGSVPRKQSDSVWQRFTTACNYFFDERKRQNKERHAVELENLEKKREIIVKLAALPKDGDRKEIMPQIKELQAEFQAVGFVPFKQKDKVFAEYRAVCDELYDAYNKREARQRMSNFQTRVNEIKGDGNKVSRERDRLLRIVESRKNELKTIENNMGFFSIKSSAGNSMVKDMENKIKRIKDDIKELLDKVAILDAENND